MASRWLSITSGHAAMVHFEGQGEGYFGYCDVDAHERLLSVRNRALVFDKLPSEKSSGNCDGYNWVPLHLWGLPCLLDLPHT